MGIGSYVEVIERLRAASEGVPKDIKGVLAEGYVGSCIVIILY